jgi:hypothetical protein
MQWAVFTGTAAATARLNAHNTRTTSEKIYPLIDTNLSIQARTPLKRMHPCTYEASATLIIKNFVSLRQSQWE